MEGVAGEHNLFQRDLLLAGCTSRLFPESGPLFESNRKGDQAGTDPRPRIRNSQEKFRAVLAPVKNPYV